MRSTLLEEGLETVIWDWNGTLLDDVDLAIEIMNGLLGECGLPALDRARYHAVFDFPVRRYYERLGFGEEHGTFEELALRFMRVYDRRVRDCALHDGAGELLERCTARGVRHCVLTAARRTAVEALLDHYGIGPAIGTVLGHEDDYADTKEGLGVRWLEAAAVDPNRTVLVGDTVHDFEVAEAMGVRCILVAHGHHTADRLAQCGCPVIPSLRALF